jgi:hypothetical protein
MTERAAYRTFGVDYTGGPIPDEQFDDLHDAVVALFETVGRKVEGTSDGPMQWIVSPDD